MKISNRMPRLNPWTNLIFMLLSFLNLALPEFPVLMSIKGKIIFSLSLQSCLPLKEKHVLSQKHWRHHPFSLFCSWLLLCSCPLREQWHILSSLAQTKWLEFATHTWPGPSFLLWSCLSKLLVHRSHAIVSPPHSPQTLRTDKELFSLLLTC